MSFSAQTLIQARQAMIVGAQQRISLLGQIADQNRKIFELEQEIQRLAGSLSQTQQALVDARGEIEALRAQLPDAATIAAYEALVEFMVSPERSHPELRIAA